MLTLTLHYTNNNKCNKQDVIMSYGKYRNTGDLSLQCYCSEQIMTQGSTLLEVYGINSGKNYI